MTLCLLCPGQGSQSPEMFERLRADPLAGEHAARLAALLPWDAYELARDPARCFANRYAQVLICLHAVLVGAVLRDAQIFPALVAGYSVGELAAHGLAGALPPAALLAAAEARAAAMDACTPPDAGMLAVRGLRRAEMEAQALAFGVDVAICNGEEHVVLAGPQVRLDALAARLGGQGGVHLVRLPIGVPAHSHWLSPAVDVFAHSLAQLPWQPAPLPVIAGIDGSIVRDAPAAIQTLSRQLATRIEWARVLDVAVEMGARVFFEVGPGNALSRMALERHPQIPARALGDFSSLQGALAWLRRYAA